MSVHTALMSFSRSSGPSKLHAHFVSYAFGAGFGAKEQ